MAQPMCEIRSVPVEHEPRTRDDVGVVRQGAGVGGDAGEGLRGVDVVPDREVVVGDGGVWEGDGLVLGISALWWA